MIEKLALVMKPLTSTTTFTTPDASLESNLRSDLVSALANLGYPPNPIKAIVDRLFEDDSLESLGFEACLRRALGELSGRTGTVAEGARNA